MVSSFECGVNVNQSALATYTLLVAYFDCVHNRVAAVIGQYLIISSNDIGTMQRYGVRCSIIGQLQG
jgi:hypothetical protein